MTPTSPLGSHRGGPAHRGPSAWESDSLNRLLAELGKPGALDPAARGVQEHKLGDYVEAETRDLKGEALNRFLFDVYKRIETLAQSSAPEDRQAALLAIDELIDVKIAGEHAHRVAEFVGALKHVLQPTMDCPTAELAASVMGHLVRASGALTADAVEDVIRTSIEWLRNIPTSAARFGAVVLLREMAVGAPAVFNVHVRAFLDAIWYALRDKEADVRRAANAALNACLCLVEKRDTRYRVQWYYRLFEQTKRGLLPDPRTNEMRHVEEIHGSLMAFGELLSHTGEFMLARYKDVVELALKFRDSKDKHIRRAVIDLLPKFAAFAPEKFSRSSYLETSVTHLLQVLRTNREPGAAFTSLGFIALALARHDCAGCLSSKLPAISAQIREALLSHKHRARRPQALNCCGVLARALRDAWLPYAQELLEPMVMTGLSPPLVEALQATAEVLPALLEGVQARLMDLLSLALAKTPFNPRTPPTTIAALMKAIDQGDAKGVELTQLALSTLRTFDFSKYTLLDFARQTILPFLDDVDRHIRIEAATAAIAICEAQVGPNEASAGALGYIVSSASSDALASSIRAVSASKGSLRSGLLDDMSQHASDDSPLARGLRQRNNKIIEEVVLRLLVAGATDVVRKVRHSIFDTFFQSARLDLFLAHADCLRPLCCALLDEHVPIRAAAIHLVGRLSALNPAGANPAIRRQLMQILNDMEHSPDSKQREDSAYLLGCVIHAAPKIIMPYLSPICKALVAKLHAPHASPQPYAEPAFAPRGGRRCEDRIVTSVLATTGELATVAGPEFKPYVPEVLPLIINAVQDPTDTVRRITAANCLGAVLGATGTVISPYTEYPALLGVLLRMLNDGISNARIRLTVTKVMGIIGALDPYVHKMNHATLSGEGKLEREGVRPLRKAPHGALPLDVTVGTVGAAASGLPDADLELLPANGLVTNNKDYYPTVAINALLKILADQNMSSHHKKVIDALMKIFKAQSLGCVPYLTRVIPILLAVIRAADEPLREVMFGNLTELVTVVRAHICKFLPDIMALAHEFWSLRSPHGGYVLPLVARLSEVAPDDFRFHIPTLLPKLIAALQAADRSGSYDRAFSVLKTLEALGPALQEHLHLVLPALVRLITPGVSNMPLEVRKAVLATMARLLPRLQLAGYVSMIIHPMVRVLDGPYDRLRERAIDAICAMAVALGPDLGIFVPTISRVLGRRRIVHDRWNSIATQLMGGPAPCMSDAPDWESSTVLAQELAALESSQQQVPALAATPAKPPLRPAKVNEANLRQAWESSQRVTKDDWAEWMRHFAVELLKESPSPALKACYGLAVAHPSMAKDLFPAGFVSCWMDLDEGKRHQLVRSLEAALAAPTIPPEIVTTLLNLAEFMEHDEKPFPVDMRTLGALAEKCHAFAKALHYKELEYGASPGTAVEALISINNQLRLPDAAIGMLIVAQRRHQMELKESWYEKLHRWDDALEAYDRKYRASERGSRERLDGAIGRMRCLAALAEWEHLAKVCSQEWSSVEPQVRREIAPLAAHAAWHMGQWDSMAAFVDEMDSWPEAGSASSSSSAFLRAVLAVRHGRYEAGLKAVARAREMLSTELAALVGESYERGYGDMVRVQQLTELEEVIEFRQAATRAAASGDTAGLEARQRLIRSMWRARMQGVQRNVEVWQALLSVRSLLLPMGEDTGTWLKFSSLCRKSGRLRQANRTLLQLLRYNPHAVTTPGTSGYGAGSGAPEVMYAYLKFLWHTGERREAYSRLTDLAAECAELHALHATDPSAYVRSGAAVSLVQSTIVEAPLSKRQSRVRPSLYARTQLRLGLWRWSQSESALDDATIQAVLQALNNAHLNADSWGKAWHHWALFNVACMDHHATAGAHDAASSHVAPAVNGFFRSVALSQAGGALHTNLQDILRLLTLWFNHGSAPDVHAALCTGFAAVAIDTWLVVIPQIIARIHVSRQQIRELIHELLCKIGRHHPQALMYPLLVACKSQSASRRDAAFAVLENVRLHTPALVEQAQLVSGELIRMAILWHEMWHEALEEASRLYFGQSNVEGMLAVLLPLHEMMETAGPTTLKEIAFVQAFGRELREAHDWCFKYKQSHKDAELHQAWDLYYHVFKRINKQLPQLTTLELQYVAPALVRSQGLELAVPGTYIAGEPVVTITAFAPTLHVVNSKQRPRKLSIHGSDGAEYMFLLKGHEDLRQDERVMQLFGLVNNMLRADRAGAERDLSIGRYAVIPLSPNSGLIGWVPNCDTLHALIREYREARSVPLNVEHRLMGGMAPDFEHLCVIQKVEVFEHALAQHPGEDLHKVMWLKSANSEVWLEKRTHYTRSLAVMSMVGYLLGLGDRHPSNLMLDRYSGKLLHIDFGDCFEASMHRDKFPEKVPFRLTRMMVQAMEVSGIEGTFRLTCENVMRVLRENKDSVMAMLEAFVHDPLINWRLLNTTDAVGDKPTTPAPTEPGVTASTTAGATATGAPNASEVPPAAHAMAAAMASSQSNLPPTSNPAPAPYVAPTLPHALPTTTPSAVAAATAAVASGSTAMTGNETTSGNVTASNAASAGNATAAAATTSTATGDAGAAAGVEGEATAGGAAGGDIPSPPRRDAREKEILAAYGQLARGDANEMLNDRAMKVMARMTDKLMGRDCVMEGVPGIDTSDAVHRQVDRLIRAATSHENLCQSYIGWCPFW